MIVIMVSVPICSWRVEVFPGVGFDRFITPMFAMIYACVEGFLNKENSETKYYFWTLQLAL